MNSACKACTGTWPPKDHHIFDCGQARAYLHEDQFFLGWTVLVLNRHATELFDLSAREREQLIESISLIAHGLKDELEAVKINYELLGNQLPHIHWHLIPRLADDPAPLEPVWRIPHEPRCLTSHARQDIIFRLRRRFADYFLE
jgi:diadenosine tetraphosphate (Ap4A) HIT family hydrolase